METKGLQHGTAVLRYLVIVLLLVALPGLSGCVTKKVLELRQEREARTKEKINFWSLSAVTSAQVVSGTEVFACVEFRDSPSDAPQPFTINLSQAQRIGKTYGDFMPHGYGRTGPAEDPVWYLYPLQDALKGCVKATGESPFPVSELKVETLRIDRADQPKLSQLLRADQAAPDTTGRVVDVRFTPKGQGAAPEDVLLVYLPAVPGGEPAPMVGVAGAFEPGSEWLNPYTLLVVPAIATDTAIVAMAIMIMAAPYAHR
jgi:hypothetical protein